MKKQSVNELINHLEEKAEQHIQIAIQNFQNLEKAQLEKPSVSNGWSIVQCLEHLNSYGHYYLPQIKKALSETKINSADHFKSGWLGNYFTNLMDPEKSKTKMKSPRDHVPSNIPETYGVIAEFIRQQEELIQLLNLSRGKGLNTRIPISISKLVKLKLGDVFGFLIAHDERHIRQALKNL